MTTPNWPEIILRAPDAVTAWKQINAAMLDLARRTPSPVALHEATVVPDRLLSETAWELWQSFHAATERTATALADWYRTPSPVGKAVLVLDAMSLRELSLVLGGAERRQIVPTAVKLTSAEIPTDTNAFAKALGVPTRAALSNNGAPAGFILPGMATDVLTLPFLDCLANVPNQPAVLIWHTWLDDQIHLHKKAPDQVAKLAASELQGDGFWALVNRLRQGRELVIVGDHGYAASKNFSSQEHDQAVIDILRNAFGASRSCPAVAGGTWPHPLMPPFVLTANGHHVVTGQRFWTVQGGYPPLCHGGLSLLEALVPFIVLPPRL